MKRRHSINREASIDYVEYLLSARHYDQNGILDFVDHKFQGGLEVIDRGKRAKKNKMMRKMRARKFDMRKNGMPSARGSWQMSTEDPLQKDWDDWDDDVEVNRYGSVGDGSEVIADVGNAEGDNGGSTEAT